MAFTMDGEILLPASRQAVWAGLNDPDVLRRCITGCQKLEQVDDNAFAAEVKMKIGPVSSVFNGKVQLRDLDPPNGYRIEGQGEGGAAGFAKGGANVLLSDADGGTRLCYDVNVDIGGRLAQLGGRLINGVARKQADLFFAAFAAQFAEAPAGGGAQGAAVASEAAAFAFSPALPAADQSASAPLAMAPPPPWAWLFALGFAIVAGYVLGRSGAPGLWAVAMLLLALASAGAGYRSAFASLRR